MTLNDAGILNYLSVLFFASCTSIGIATSLSFCLCLWRVCWHFPWQAAGLFGTSRDCIPTTLAAVIILVPLHVSLLSSGAVPDVVHVLCSSGPSREAVCQLERHQEGAEAMALVPASAPGKGGIPFPSSMRGAQDVSLHRLRTDSSGCRSRSSAECNKRLSQSFWKSGPTSEVEGR